MKTAIVLGARGLVGSAVCARLEGSGFDLVRVHSRNYAEHAGYEADVLINCNGNAYRFRANQDPAWDYEASVVSVERSLEDFSVDPYVYVSTIDVYSEKGDPSRNHEDMIIDSALLDAYGQHKRQAEAAVQAQARNFLILRLGTAIGDGLKKGPLYDMLHESPLHMSLDSELSLVDTAFMATAIDQFIASRPEAGVINLTGTGSVRLRDLVPFISRPVQVLPGAENTCYSYDINTTRLQRLMSVPTSLDMARRVLMRMAA